MLWHGQAIFESKSKGDMLSASAECKIRSWEVWDTKSPPGGRLNKKDGLTRCGDSHVKDKTS